MCVCLIVDFSNLDVVRRIRPLTFPFQCGREKNQFISLIFLSMSCNFNQGKEIDLNLFYIMWKKNWKEIENAFQATIQSFYYRYFAFIFHGKTRFFLLSSLPFHFDNILFIIVLRQACF